MKVFSDIDKGLEANGFLKHKESKFNPFSCIFFLNVRHELFIMSLTFHCCCLSVLLKGEGAGDHPVNLFTSQIDTAFSCLTVNYMESTQQQIPVCTQATGADWRLYQGGTK
uniref:Uncharacterized protein n=1 Tax=Micrurus spixii TaxID=129469 RepID=A0A2D4LNG2_9SAUR